MGNWEKPYRASQYLYLAVPYSILQYDGLLYVTLPDSTLQCPFVLCLTLPFTSPLPPHSTFQYSTAHRLTLSYLAQQYLTASAPHLTLQYLSALYLTKPTSPHFTVQYFTFLESRSKDVAASRFVCSGVFRPTLQDVLSKKCPPHDCIPRWGG